MLKTKNPAIEIIGDPTATEEQWIPACALVEQEYRLRYREQRAGAIGWLAAFIDATVSATSSCFLVGMSTVGTLNHFGFAYPELIPVSVGVPFAFSFVYGLWKEHYKGGTAWSVGYYLPALVIIPTIVSLRLSCPFTQYFLYLVIAVSGALTGLHLGEHFFRRLKRVIKPWNIIGIGQLSLLAYPLIVCLLPGDSAVLLPIFVALSFMIGALTSFAAKGQSLKTTMSLSIAAIALPVLFGFTVLLFAILNLSPYHSLQVVLGIFLSLAALICLTVTGAATGHWILKHAALPDGDGGFRFDAPCRDCSASYSQSGCDHNQDENLALQAVRVSGAA